jgi:hypothetical protein
MAVLVVRPSHPISKGLVSTTDEDRPCFNPSGEGVSRSYLVRPNPSDPLFLLSTIIMDIHSTLPSRSASPTPESAPEPQVLDEAHREGLKKVLKEVKAPPPEFDMSSFDF